MASIEPMRNPIIYLLATVKMEGFLMVVFFIGPIWITWINFNPIMDR